MRESYPSISRRISDIFKEYYKKRAEEKFASLLNHAEEYVDALDLDNNFRHYIDKFRFYALVKSYYLDVIRYKEYHFNNKKKDDIPDESIDCYSKEWSKYIHGKLISKDKAASLTANWIMKYSPIHIHPEKGYTPTEEQERKIIMANSGFAIDNSIATMKIELETVEPSIIKDLEYHFLYRPIDERHLFLVYRQILASSHVGIMISKQLHCNNLCFPKRRAKVIKRVVGESSGGFGFDDSEEYSQKILKVRDHISRHYESLNMEAIWLFVATLATWSVTDKYLRVMAALLVLVLLGFKIYENRSDRRPFKKMLVSLRNEIKKSSLEDDVKKARLYEIGEAEKELLNWKSMFLLTPKFLICYVF